MSIGKSKPKTTVAPPVPSAFAKQPSTFAPPPLRRVSVSPAPVSYEAEEADSVVEDTDDGEWVEALYDYNSGVRSCQQTL